LAIVTSDLQRQPRLPAGTEVPVRPRRPPPKAARRHRRGRRAPRL